MSFEIFAVNFSEFTDWSLDLSIALRHTNDLK